MLIGKTYVVPPCLTSLTSLQVLIRKDVRSVGHRKTKHCQNLARGSSSSSWLTTSLLLTSRKRPAITSSLAQPLQSSFSKSTNVFTSARGMLYIPEISNVAAIHNKNNKWVCISWKEANSHPHTIKVGQMLNPRINCVDSPKDFVEELPLFYHFWSEHQNFLKKYYKKYSKSLNTTRSSWEKLKYWAKWQ